MNEPRTFLRPLYARTNSDWKLPVRSVFVQLSQKMRRNGEKSYKGRSTESQFQKYTLVVPALYLDGESFAFNLAANVSLGLWTRTVLTKCGLMAWCFRTLSSVYLWQDLRRNRS